MLPHLVVAIAGATPESASTSVLVLLLLLLPPPRQYCPKDGLLLLLQCAVNTTAARRTWGMQVGQVLPWPIVLQTVNLAHGLEGFGASGDRLWTSTWQAGYSGDTVKCKVQFGFVVG
jgi:hypothetical protein